MITVDVPESMSALNEDGEVDIEGVVASFSKHIHQKGTLEHIYIQITYRQVLQLCLSLVDANSYEKGQGEGCVYG